MIGFFSRLLRRLALATTAAVLLIGTPAQAQSNDYTQTRYPIVLVHGIYGFDSALGIDYFYGIPDALRQGGATVHVAQVSAVNSSEVRGEQLLTQVKTIIAMTGATKVNLIGHSQGATTVRYVAGVAPELVASVTSVGGNNRGSRVADLVAEATPEGSVASAIATSANYALAALINLVSGGTGLPQLPAGALNSLTTAGLAEFNSRFPQAVPSDCGNGPALVNGVRYYSWTGIQPVTNVLDPSDALLGVLGLVFGEPNDGLVPACSSRLGEHLGDYRQNHLDEVNQLLGLRDWLATDPVTLYRQHANRLKQQGL
ncbi:triacylglycerol lipase [Acidovorax sp.]|uniref:esterase/lipase family protein n=1 Tax=Acidovorax sp. TaxID=1872122 RepID=UPI00260C18D3|nr:triacylglycerol lipase [Acidovorax sp.]